MTHTNKLLLLTAGPTWSGCLIFCTAISLLLLPLLSAWFRGSADHPSWDGNDGLRLRGVARHRRGGLGQTFLLLPRLLPEHNWPKGE